MRKPQFTPTDSIAPGAYSVGDRKAIGEALMRARKELGFSQRQLEQASKVPQAKISRIERGAARATVTELDELASALRLTVQVVILNQQETPAG